MNVKILVAAHKQYQMPEDKELYLPIFVGKALHESDQVTLPYLGDDTGANISLKNPFYNELTAQYWAWHNLDNVDAVGLVHYRRYFRDPSAKRATQNKFQSILTQGSLNQLLHGHDIIVPNKRHYYIETNQSHYVHAHHSTPLAVTRQVIEKDYPRYLAAYDQQMQARSAHMFNMFVMKRPQFEAYSYWLFDVLARVEAQVDISNYSPYEQRVFGFISELLLDVWLYTTNQNYTECQYMFMEHQNWVKKGGKFLLRKFRQR
ncbi:DUF4422 domain-containing protein [Lactobacillus sp. CC-MHH1034]|uniref:DUF4422 domain-containing protein n=1 Tax=Agrilactobacillus fermenti TaxID=2586909 RepID=UPI001E47D9C8|nr:DUF4422 domain-containing protein [Agrilactobacillus fermenti]MCD2255874.1 DUF4422 domain-containing protein [Agrilactobacillus fermenti]